MITPDCLSSFLWVKAEYLLMSLYSGKMVIPQTVYNELSNPTTPQLKMHADTLIANGDATLQPILTDTVEYSLYNKLTSNPDEGHINRAYAGMALDKTSAAFAM